MSSLRRLHGGSAGCAARPRLMLVPPLRRLHGGSAGCAARPRLMLVPPLRRLYGGSAGCAARPRLMLMPPLRRLYGGSAGCAARPRLMLVSSLRRLYGGSARCATRPGSECATLAHSLRRSAALPGGRFAPPVLTPPQTEHPPLIYLRIDPGHTPGTLTTFKSHTTTKRVQNRLKITIFTG